MAGEDDEDLSFLTIGDARPKGLGARELSCQDLDELVDWREEEEDVCPIVVPRKKHDSKCTCSICEEEGTSIGDENWDEEIRLEEAKDPNGTPTTRTASIDAEALRVGLNVKYLQRLSLPQLRSEVYAFFTAMHSRYERVTQLLEKTPMVSYQVMLQGLQKRIQIAPEAAKPELEQLLTKVQQDLAQIKANSNATCLLERRNILQGHQESMAMCMKGFDPYATRVDRLEGLPGTSSNAEGNLALLRLLYAFDALALAEGRSKNSSVKLMLEFQRLASTLLEKHQIEEPKWGTREVEKMPETPKVKVPTEHAANLSKILGQQASQAQGGLRSTSLTRASSALNMHEVQLAVQEEETPRNRRMSEDVAAPSAREIANNKIMKKRGSKPTPGNLGVAATAMSKSASFTLPAKLKAKGRLGQVLQEHDKERKSESDKNSSTDPPSLSSLQKPREEKGGFTFRSVSPQPRVATRSMSPFRDIFHAIGSTSLAKSPPAPVPEAPPLRFDFTPPPIPPKRSTTPHQIHEKLLHEKQHKGEAHTGTSRSSTPHSAQDKQQPQTTPLKPEPHSGTSRSPTPHQQDKQGQAPQDKTQEKQKVLHDQLMQSIRDKAQPHEKPPTGRERQTSQYDRPSNERPPFERPSNERQASHDKPPHDKKQHDKVHEKLLHEKQPQKVLHERPYEKPPDKAQSPLKPRDLSNPPHNKTPMSSPPSRHSTGSLAVS